MTLASLPRKGERIKKAVAECRTAQGLDHVEPEEVEAGEAEEEQPRPRRGVHLFVGGRRGQAVHHRHHEGQEAADPPGPFVMTFMIKIGIFITNPCKLMNNVIS